MLENQTHQPIRKVTLSCRVLPEQKLLIAERAKSVDMSLSQYVEAKVLQNDNLELEKNIQRLEIELEQRKAEIQNLTEGKSIIEQELNHVQKKFDAVSHKLKTKSDSKRTALKLTFKDEKEKNLFVKKLSSIAKKYEIKSLQTTLKLCLEYTIKNERSFFILKTVKEFFQKESTTKLSLQNQTP